LQLEVILIFWAQWKGLLYMKSGRYLMADGLQAGKLSKGKGKGCQFV